ncbi:MAG: sulfurtransferase [Saprospiraceae bacterium]
MTELVSTKWLAAHQNDKDLIILDASIKKVTASTSTENNLTIAGARFFDIKGSFSDSNSAFPNTLPPAAQFELECQKLGINSHSKIVVFDKLGVYSSPRAWWMFRVMGHENVAVLDGGLPAWIKDGYPTTPQTDETYPTGNFKATFQPKLVKSYQDIVENIETEQFNVLDARSAGRFNGTAPEPRKHLQSGHIPKSTSLPFTEVLENGKYKSADELQAIFENKNLSDNDLVFSCGSGITACIIMLASEIAYKKSPYIYDGSWSEWAELQNLKVEEG